MGWGKGGEREGGGERKGRGEREGEGLRSVGLEERSLMAGEREGEGTTTGA